MPKESILIVDDEAGILELLRYNLGKDGCRVLSAESGEKGLEIARESVPDLVILDLMLPGIDGLEVCRLIKQDKRTCGIAVVMLTAKNSEIDEVVGLEVGASDYLAKPFSVKVLLARIKNILRKKNKQDATDKDTVIKSGDFLLDKNSVRFLVKGKSIELTKTEFNIMTVLMEKPDTVILRDRLVSTAWGPACVVSQASVNMQIKSLREKLGKYSSSIETVRGLGYRFNNKFRSI